MKVTIKDVARQANVSISTVSRVISGSPRISDATKKRVNKIIKELNYKPNSIARRLVGQNSMILGIVLPREVGISFNNPFFIEMMIGLSDIAEKNNYYIMYACGKTEEDELKHIKEFEANNLIDGICLLTARKNDKCIKYLSSSSLPFVVVGTPEEENAILWVDNDNFKVAFDLVNSLVEKGYKKIAYIGASENFNFSKNRFKGYTTALYANQLTPDENLIFSEDNYSEEEGYKAAKKLFEYTCPDIIISTEDLLAIGANRFIFEHKLSTKIICFNNTPNIKYQNPPISSISINPYNLGYEAGELLIRKLKGELVTPIHKIVESTLINR
ncbi:MAG: LacI family DNA-binding transcriptional regulator [Sarcina sp.]